MVNISLQVFGIPYQFLLVMVALLTIAQPWKSMQIIWAIPWGKHTWTPTKVVKELKNPILQDSTLRLMLKIRPNLLLVTRMVVSIPEVQRLVFWALEEEVLDYRWNQYFSYSFWCRCSEFQWFQLIHCSGTHSIICNSLVCNQSSFIIIKLNNLIFLPFTSLFNNLLKGKLPTFQDCWFERLHVPIEQIKPFFIPLSSHSPSHSHFVFFSFRIFCILFLISRN